MKNLILLIGICLLFPACANPYIYQLSSVKSNNVPLNDNHTFVYVDSLFIITYDFWSDGGGTMSFKIYNRTNVPLYIDWNKSNFILNGKSFDYWQDIETTKSNGTTTTTGYTNWYATPNNVNSDKYSVSDFSATFIKAKDKPNNQIPPHAYLQIDRFNIKSYFWLFPNYPKKNDSIVRQYDSSNSLLSFRNYIAWTKNQDLSTVKFIDNSFWIDKITCINNDYKYGDYPSSSGWIAGSIIFTKERYIPNSFFTYKKLNEIPVPSISTAPK